MRQAGILAAAGILALTENVDRLAEDHANARRLAEGLAAIPGLGLDPSQVQTNMVFLCLPLRTADRLASFLNEQGILISGRESIRLVTHLDVTSSDVERVIAAFGAFFAGHGEMQPGASS